MHQGICVWFRAEPLGAASQYAATPGNGAPGLTESTVGAGYILRTSLVRGDITTHQ